jgi:hypothetical protein
VGGNPGRMNNLIFCLDFVKKNGENAGCKKDILKETGKV